MTDHRSIRLGTRSSKLALWQANWTAEQIRKSGHAVEIVQIKTEGDISTASLSSIGGQGVFTKRIQLALLNDEIDLAVHSLKDLPTSRVEGLAIAAVPQRESTFDVLVASSVDSIDQLSPQSRLGTGSARRQAQLLCYRSDLQLADIRGNVDTRLQKLDDGEFDAIILAEAGLRRLGLNHRITQRLPQSWMLPAIGQGALGLETRDDDFETRNALESLNCPMTQRAVLAERSLLRELGAGCLAPVGCLTTVDGDQLNLQAVVLTSDGQVRLNSEQNGPLAEPERIGMIAAQDLARIAEEKSLGQFWRD